MRIAVLCDHWAELSETFIAGEAGALAALGHELRVEADRRADTANPEAPPLPVAFVADDTPLRKLADLAWLAGRHPVRVLRDLRARRRWRAQEHVRPLRSLAPTARRVSGCEHLHAHFAAGAALDALRVGRLLGLPYSVTAHAYDIYQHPANLREKLERAALATSGCDYTVEELRTRVSPRHAERIHKIVMGVDPEHFRRRAPLPGGRTVLAVGRLVEKKGFAHLIDAAAQLRRRGAVEQVLIAGEGPLRRALEAQVTELGLEGTVELLGARSPQQVRELLERADVVAVPSVVASDGDRDSMPVVAKEALAMEVPVVASEEVGLPELVRPQWGRLSPPGDVQALAAAIDELLSLGMEERAGMGRAGRQWVIETCNVRLETARLARLIREPASIIIP